jgi:hypothetical protein
MYIASQVGALAVKLADKEIKPKNQLMPVVMY